MADLMATFHLGEFLCGVSTVHVQEVLLDQPRTPAPGAAPCVAGLINLRGNVVTAMDLRVRMGLGDPDATAGSAPSMNVVVRWQGEVWSLLVDRIGDVIEVDDTQFELPPDTLHGPLRDLIVGAYKLGDRLLLVLDVPALLAISREPELR